MLKIKSLKEYNGKIKRVVISKEQIEAAVAETGKRLDALYDGNPLLIISVLSGSLLFTADLCRALSVPCELCDLRAKSYHGGTASSGQVDITESIGCDVSKYHVVIVEDIIETGRTLKEVCSIIESRNPLSLTVVTLLDKPSKRTVDFNADISLFTIPDIFVIGYGLDYAELYRNLPYVAEFDESI